jgi:hypothetical protein
MRLSSNLLGNIIRCCLVALCILFVVEFVRHTLISNGPSIAIVMQQQSNSKNIAHTASHVTAAGSSEHEHTQTAHHHHHRYYADFRAMKRSKLSQHQITTTDGHNLSNNLRFIKHHPVAAII